MLPVFAYSLKDGERRQDAGRAPLLRRRRREGSRPTVDVVVNTMSFAMGSSSADERSDEEWAVDALRALDVPQLQAVNASVSSAEWLASEGGLSPLDVAMNVAIPELDGRIITRAALLQGAAGRRSRWPARRSCGTSRSRDRADRVIGQALRLAALRRKPNAEKRVAVVLTNHNAKASRIANAVGLDSPASLLHLLARDARGGLRRRRRAAARLGHADGRSRRARPLRPRSADR